MSVAGQMRVAISGLVLSGIAKGVYGSLSQHIAHSITCDDIKVASQTLYNPDRFLYWENCIDWDNPSFPTVKGNGNTFKNPAPQQIGGRAYAQETCNGVTRVLYNTAWAFGYNVKQVYSPTGSGTYGQCLNHDTRFRTWHYFYQSDPYLNEAKVLWNP